MSDTRGTRFAFVATPSPEALRTPLGSLKKATHTMVPTRSTAALSTKRSDRVRAGSAAAAPTPRSAVELSTRPPAKSPRSAAVLYGVQTGRLIEQVKRNIDRFPSDFMFQLTKDEVTALRSQSATSKEGRGRRRYAPSRLQVARRREVGSLRFAGLAAER
jgi:hypothetical protein